MIEKHVRMFAAYNRWANSVLYDAAATLGDDDYRRDMGAFFGSMMRTLNHILVADRIWMRRFTGEGPVHTALDDVIEPDFAALRMLREAMDRRILDVMNGLDAEQLAGHFTYVPVTSTQPITQTLFPAVAHLFNHQTHHRGQCHMILTALGRDGPALDLIYYLRTEEGRAFTA